MTSLIPVCVCVWVCHVCVHVLSWRKMYYWLHQSSTPTPPPPQLRLCHCKCKALRALVRSGAVKKKKKLTSSFYSKNWLCQYLANIIVLTCDVYVRKGPSVPPLTLVIFFCLADDWWFFSNLNLYLHHGHPLVNGLPPSVVRIHRVTLPPSYSQSLFSWTGGESYACH